MRFRYFSAALLLALLVPLFSFAAVTVSVNGSNHTIPQTNEKGWGSNVTAWIQAISLYTLQPSGGTFTLGADVDFGANYGLKSIYLKSRASAPSSSGVLRMGNAEYIGWRNAGDSANYLLGVNSSNQLTFNGVVLASSTGPLFQDSLFTVFDNSDTTKLLQFQLSGITTGTTRTLTVPDASTTLVGTDTTDTLTNKTLTSPIIGTISNTGTLTLPTSTDTLVGRDTTDTLTNKTLSAALSTGQLGIADGSSSAPSIGFSDDTNTGVYSSAADTLDIVAAAQQGLEVKKSAGSFANVGMGGASASGSDSYPLLIERTVANQLVQQTSNPSSDAAASAKIQLSTDAGDKLGELGVFPNEATTHAYSAAMTVRPNGNSAKLSLIGGDLSTGHVAFYTAGDYASTGEALRVNADKSLQLMQQIATPTTPASGTGKLFTKSDDKLYFINDGGTETDLISKSLAYSDINGLTEDTSPATGDYVITGDVSATATKKVQLSKLGIGFTKPTIQKFTSGSGTYTTATGAQWLRVRMIGGGGGGSNSGANSGTATASGTATTFGAGSASAGGGGGGTTAGIGGPGGTNSLTTSASVIQLANNSGSAGASGTPNILSSSQVSGGMGGSSYFSGNGTGGTGGTGGGSGTAAASNTGSGGGGGLGNQVGQTITTSGAGGGSGGYLEFIVTSPSSTYSYAVGAAGDGGSGNGTTGYSGGNGGSGLIIVEEYYQ